MRRGKSCNEKGHQVLLREQRNKTKRGLGGGKKEITALGTIQAFE